MFEKGNKNIKSPRTQNMIFMFPKFFSCRWQKTKYHGSEQAVRKIKEEEPNQLVKHQPRKERNRKQNILSFQK